VPYNLTLNKLEDYLKENISESVEFAKTYVGQMEEFEALQEKLMDIMPLERLERRKLKERPYDLQKHILCAKKLLKYLDYDTFLLKTGSKKERLL
jgi:hypothetical protein